MDKISLPLSFIKSFIKHEILYPLTPWEAIIDIIANCHPEGEGAKDQITQRWGWSEKTIVDFLDECVAQQFINIDGDTIVIVEPMLFYDTPVKQTKKEDREFVESVMTAYNKTMGRKYGTNPYRERTILKRFREGQTMKPQIGLLQFEAVFAHKYGEWKDTDSEKWLEPETLCADKHFFKYLDQAREAHRKKIANKKYCVWILAETSEVGISEIDEFGEPKHFTDEATLRELIMVPFRNIPYAEAHARAKQISLDRKLTYIPQK